MAEVRIAGEEGRALVLQHPQLDGDGGWRYTATLEFETGRASVKVWDYGDPRLPEVFRQAADQWRGFQGAIEFASIEGQLEMALTHDGKGTISCVATVRQPWPPTWRTTIELSFGAGAHAEQIARDVEAFFARAAPA